MAELPTRRQRHIETKQAILQAARALILEKGADKLSLREIARRIGYSPAGLYEYFGSKEEIVAAVAAEGFEQLHAYLNRVPNDLPPMQRLVAIGLAYVQFAQQYPEHFMLIFSRLPSGRISLQAPAGAHSPYQIVLQAIQDGVDAGALALPAGSDLEEMAYSLWAMAHGMAMLQQTHLRDFQADFPALDQRVLEALVQGWAYP
jgi:AcrR family transcriptional regulator